ncbi:TPA: hypothetical protein KXU27_004557, partial [Salmonella enterica subsp. enterica serovar Enteritidis]|nr:hypothetical protein [Salmonella enterica subsp. enterica serovar Enteritidis]
MCEQARQRQAGKLTVTDDNQHDASRTGQAACQAASFAVSPPAGRDSSQCAIW